LAASRDLITHWPPTQKMAIVYRPTKDFMNIYISLIVDLIKQNPNPDPKTITYSGP